MAEETFSRWYGIIDILTIQNIPAASGKDEIQMPLMKDNALKFVHYPDCQQLIIWLPEYYAKYNTLEIFEKITNKNIFNSKISDIINGSIQIIIDSLFIEPGEYEIIIKNNTGDVHKVDFIKHDEGYIPPELPKEETIKLSPNITQSEQMESENIYKVYKDGAGNVLPNEDLELREKLLHEVAGKFTRKLEYTGNLRAGSIIYVEGETRISFDTEMGGGKCLFFVFIPNKASWEKSTGKPLRERDSILEFIAIRANRDQASSCYYEITEDYITYYHR